MIYESHVKKAIIGCSLILTAVNIFTLNAAAKEHSVRELSEIYDINYTETTEDEPNPGRGFYDAKAIHYLISGNKADTYAPKLYHMRLDISQFAAAYNDQKQDIELSEDMLDALDKTLSNLETKHSCAIIRFAYDPYFEGKNTIHEPSIEMINRHQEQLGEVLSKHDSCIVSVELGLFGKWGEMHSGDKCSQENYNKAISKWLEVLPDSIPISVRTPGQYAGWAGVDRAKLNENITVKGEAAYRVGVYNDGYLGSDNDLGTYADRLTETEWLSNQAKHTLFGGEIVANDNKGQVKNTAAFMETEAFTTHTSYLNIAWNDKVIAAMKEEAYSGNDPLYKGMKGFEYIRNHLGYRFVVRDVRLTKETTSKENFKVEVDVENVGFANLVKEKEIVLILKGQDNTYCFPVSKLSGGKAESAALTGNYDVVNGLNESVENGNPSEWDSGGITTFKACCDLDDNMPLGNYEVYLRIADDADKSGLEGYPIRFANADLVLKTIQGNEEQTGIVSVWNEDIGANYLGGFIITDKMPEPKKDEGQSGNNGENGQNGQSGENKQDDRNTQGNNNPEECAPIGLGIKAGDKHEWRAPDGSGEILLFTSVDYNNRTGTATVLWYKEAGKTVEIKDEIDWYGLKIKITGIADGACRENKKATSVVIGKNVKRIGKKAFYGLKKCKTLTIRSKRLNKNNVGKKTFGNMNKKMLVKLPKSKYKTYKKWIYKKGLSRKCRLTKVADK